MYTRVGDVGKTTSKIDRSIGGCEVPDKLVHLYMGTRVGQESAIVPLSHEVVRVKMATKQTDLMYEDSFSLASCNVQTKHSRSFL